MSVTSLHKTEWKDETTYAKGGSREPNVWAVRSGKIRISIVFGHIHYPEQWVMNCAALSIDTWPLKATKKTNLEVVKTLALEHAAEKFAELELDFEKLMVHL